MRVLSICCGALMAAGASHQALACSIAIDFPRPGEDDSAFRARLEAEEAEYLRYQNASEQERAVIDQARWLAVHRIAFVAEVKMVRFEDQIYGPDYFEPLQPGGDEFSRSQVSSSDEITVRARRILYFIERHEVYLEPITWIEGNAPDVAGWHEVEASFGACGLPDELWAARPGERVIVFGNISFPHGQPGGIEGPQRFFSLFAMPAAAAAEPRIVRAIEQAAAIDLSPSWDAAH
jgi:hypothetical protein